MSIDRELLWKAWPEGFLAMRGVRTIGGYQCLGRPIEDFTEFCWKSLNRGSVFGPMSDRKAGWFSDGTGPVPPEDVFQQGDLLPNVDPSDVATWACLLFDFATAAYQSNGMPNDIQLGGMLWAPHRGTRWVLKDGNGSICSSQLEEVVIDPAMALVLARIQLRETS